MRFAVSVTLAIALLLLAVAPGSARAEAGETGFAFLKLGVGARPMGMGSAYVALADDPTAIYWNPAGLARATRVEVTAMHNEWIQSFRQEFAAMRAPLWRGGVGLGFSGFYTDELEKRDESGTLIGHFGFNDVAATGAYGVLATPELSAGVAVRYVREMIDEEDATATALDFGALYRLADTGVTFGAALHNVGSKASFISEEFPLPRTWRVGAAYARDLTAADGRAILSAELRQTRSEDSRFHLGGEFEYRERVALRAGWKTGYDDEDFSFGLGVKRGRVGFDYALVPLSSDLGTTHFFSLTGRF